MTDTKNKKFKHFEATPKRPIKEDLQNIVYGSSQIRKWRNTQSSKSSLLELRDDHELSSSTVEQWKKQSNERGKPTVEDDVRTIETAQSQLNNGNGKSIPEQKPVFPSYYHQRDSSGNSMAELIEARDTAKGKQKKVYRQMIQNWATEHAAGFPGPYGTEPEAPNTVLQRWKTENSDENKTGQPPGSNLSDVIQTISQAQESVSKGAKPPAQPELPTIVPPPKQPQNEPSQSSTAVDAAQLGLDVAGTFDPTPFSDGINMAISAGRIFTDPERRREHLQNAVISGVSMIPYIGDTAKLLKAKRAGKVVQRTGKMVRGGEAAASTATAAQKRQARNKYRETASAIVGKPSDGSQASSDPSYQPNNQSDEAQSPATATGSNQPPRNPPPGSPPLSSPPPPDDDHNKSSSFVPLGSSSKSVRNQRDESKGIDEHDKWKEKLSESGRKVGEFAGSIGKGILKFAAFTESIHLLNAGVITLNRDLENYNGKIASSYAKSDVDDVRRNMLESEKLEGPLSELVEAQSELKDALSPIKTSLQSMGMKILTQLTNLVTFVLKIVNLLAALFEPVVKFIAFMMTAIDTIIKALNMLPGVNIQLPKKKEEEPLAWKAFLQDTADGKFDGKRPTFVKGQSQILNNQDHKDVFGP